MSQKKKQRTKQGIKRLSLNDRLFEEVIEESEPEKNFGEMLDESLSDKTEYLRRRFVMNVQSRDWRGLSGSPVYYKNKLVGIVSSGADTFITFNPPEDIQHLLNIQKDALKASK